jgi:hypothetical protein
MLSARLIKKLEGIEKCSRQGHKVRNLFNIMTNNPELWLQAYANPTSRTVLKPSRSGDAPAQGNLRSIYVREKSSYRVV